ncbi:MAG: flagellar basal body L-ring protein FlgH [Candidatus Schekmanbacteria bacterium]|nr:flagellar basal body L-ring protein FlgH [Candidatus Schekmanbacteria bacterium]
MRHITNFIYILIALIVTSCASGPDSIPLHAAQLNLDETKLAELNKDYYREGSLWPQNDNGFNLFSDNKAGKVGDIITILVNENAEATKNATTKLNKDSSLDSSASALFGFEKAIQLRNPNFNPEALMSTKHKDQFDGSGTTTRSGDLKTTISARVIKVFSNGNFLISGSREITLNEEEQIIMLTGIIRPEDISQDNTVDSSKIADAKMTYTGKGVIAEKQHPGWMLRILAWIWPF